VSDFRIESDNTYFAKQTALPTLYYSNFPTNMCTALHLYLFDGNAFWCGWSIASLTSVP